MKKVKGLLVILLMSLCIDVFASSPAKLKDFSSSNKFKQGDTIVIDTKVVYGNNICYPSYPTTECSYDYDTNVLEFVSFNNNYGLKYDPSTMLVTSDELLILDVHPYKEEEAVTVWTMIFKVKEDAEIGETTINGQTYSIIEKEESKNENVITEDAQNNIEDDSENEKGINIYLITTIVLGIVALIELIYIILKTKKA